MSTLSLLQGYVCFSLPCLPRLNCQWLSSVVNWIKGKWQTMCWEWKASRRISSSTCVPEAHNLVAELRCPHGTELYQQNINNPHFDFSYQQSSWKRLKEVTVPRKASYHLSKTLHRDRSRPAATFWVHSRESHNCNEMSSNHHYQILRFDVLWPQGAPVI